MSRTFLPWLSPVTNTSTYQRSIYTNHLAPSTGCAPIVDALTGQSYVPGTYSNGKCITGRYVAATESQVATAVRPLVDASPVDATKAVVNAGGSVNSSEFTTTGPASQIGTPTSSTTTTPTGTITTTTTPTYNYTYNGDKITYTTTNNTTTNTCTGEGSCTTTNTSTTPAPSTPQDPNDPCTADPTRLGCMQSGTTPTDPAPAPRDVPFSIDPVNFGGQGSCPAPITFAALGRSYAFEWTPMCNVLVTWVRPVVLVLSVAAAAMIFIGGLKS